jgi:ribonuclease D
LFAHDEEAMRRIADDARAEGIIALDTEFMREKTYYARLCLVQVCVGDQAWIIDPFEVADMSPLLEVLLDPHVVKVLHAGGQDMEIMTQLAGSPPVPVFDTQIAATLAGFPSQVGYARLVKDLFDVDIDKSDTYTDWSRRPLTPAQIEYALADVRYLPGAYAELRMRLERDGRLTWVEADLARLSDPATYADEPEQQWKRIKRASSLSRRQMGVLQAVTAWREREAQRRDLPRRWVVGDDTLIEVARRQPSDVAGLSSLRGLNPRALGDGGTGLLDAVKQGLALPESELPRLARRNRAVVDIEGVVELMGALVRPTTVSRSSCSPRGRTWSASHRVSATIALC